MTDSPDGRLALVADVGGTNTRVALADGPSILSDSVRRFRNAQFAGLNDIIRAYLQETGGDRPCHGACVAVAGPVHDGRAKVTNLGWIIDTDSVADATGAGTVAVLNDLQAQGHAIGFLDPSAHEQVLQAPDPGPHAAKLVVGVGTGFNAAPVYETETGRLVPPSEAGHLTLTVHTEPHWRLARFIAARQGFAEVEDVLSGRGLENIYHWLSHEAGETRRASASDIMASCRSGDDARAAETVRVFTGFLGAVAGNLALSYLPFGGIHLVGGVCRAVRPYLDRMGFETEFRDKGRFTELMSSFPVSVVEDDYAALVGCASHLTALLRPLESRPA